MDDEVKQEIEELEQLNFAMEPLRKAKNHCCRFCPTTTQKEAQFNNVILS
jgi:hypothetical protein